MSEQVAPEIKKKREDRLIAICEEVAKEYLESLNGDSERVLLEEEIKGREDYILGHTDRYIEVAVPKFMLKGREDADKEFIGVKELMASDASDNALSNMMIAKAL